jgi:hypothetical protein
VKYKPIPPEIADYISYDPHTGECRWREAYRLMDWAKDLSVQNLHSEPEAIQKLEVGISKWARQELHKAAKPIYHNNL